MRNFGHRFESLTQGKLAQEFGLVFLELWSGKSWDLKIYRCRLEWECVGVVVGVLVKTLQNQSSLTFDARGHDGIQDFRSLHMMATCLTVSQIFNHTSNEIQDLWSMCQRKISLISWCLFEFSKMLQHWMDPYKHGSLRKVSLQRSPGPWGSVVSPRNLKRTIDQFAPQFAGYEQHDAQEMCGTGVVGS